MKGQTIRTEHERRKGKEAKIQKHPIDGVLAYLLFKQPKTLTKFLSDEKVLKEETLVQT